jgi:hypothetical protein
MNETSDTPVVTARQVTRLHRLVVVSLCLNGLILLLILLGAICHHHHMRQGDFGRQGGWACGFHRHHFMEGGGWGGKFRPGPGFGGPHMGMGMSADPNIMTDSLLAHLAQQLTLTDDQKAKIKPILSAQVAQFQKEEAAQRQARQKEMQESRVKMRPLLNADQQKLLDQLPVPDGKLAPPPPTPEDKLNP